MSAVSRGAMTVVAAVKPKAILAYNNVRQRMRRKLPTVVEGYCHPRFKRVEDKFREHVDSGFEPGAAFAVYLRGERVVDLWGGYQDVESAVPWREYTLTGVASITKGVTAIALARLVEQGHLDYDKPVSDYWPEFAQKGKADITVKILLSHQAGLTEIRPPVEFRALTNMTSIEHIFAQQKPIWKPGTAIGYHIISYGLFVQTLLRKADPKHREIAQFFKEEIAQPFGIDFHVGVPLELQYRIARHYKAKFLTWELTRALRVEKYKQAFISGLFNKKLKNGMACVKGYYGKARNDPELRAIPFATGSGYSSARGLAKLFGILANDGRHDDKELLGSPGIELLGKSVVKGTDLIWKSEKEYSVGMMIVKNAEGDTVFGHPGFGGQMTYSDVKNKLGLAYLSNHHSVYAIGGDPRFTPLEKVTYECLRQT